jgi:hypothetical protein
MAMCQDEQTERPDSRRKFLRIVVTLWGIAVLGTLIGALVTPHLGSMADFVLHQTVHRGWTRLILRTEQPFFDLSTPVHAVKSYYRALYHGDASAMERLTAAPLHEQMRLRLAAAGTPPNPQPYHSYLRTEVQEAQSAVVVEKFHLFWQRGLRFMLRRHAAEWYIVGMELLQE